MSSDLDETHRNRHEKIVSYANDIWQLEKEKYEYRKALSRIREGLEKGRRSNLPEYKASVLEFTKGEKSAKKSIEEIIERQHKILKKIEEIINN